MDEKNKNKVIHNILDNYQQVERTLVEQLYMKHDIHGTTIGMCREDVWEELFQMVIPKKFVMEHSVFIIDAGGGVSKEVDLVIMDEMYTPYIFHYGRLKFIPIEAVAAVIECKSKGGGLESEINEWCKRIEGLETAATSITRFATMITDGPVPTQKSTRPIRILCTMNPVYIKTLESKFDFIVCVEEREMETPPQLNIHRNHELENLWDCYKTLNFYRREDEIEKAREDMKPGAITKSGLKKIKLDDEYKIAGQELLTFNMQLNQMLMLINNPMPFPHRSYVAMFNEYAKK